MSGGRDPEGGILSARIRAVEVHVFEGFDVLYFLTGRKSDDDRDFTSGRVSQRATAAPLSIFLDEDLHGHLTSAWVGRGTHP